MKSISPAEFSRLMEPLGPFEPTPVLCAAVSGGADSMALALSAAHWAHERGGRVTAITVDHRLRPNSTAEAVMVGKWLKEAGIEHRILPWLGDKPTSDIQGKARAARYALLEEFCRSQGVLHLLTGHHQEDQAETFLLRLARGSGVDGLSAVSAVSHRPHLRLLRPFLSVPKDRLRATLRALDQDWVEDSSNLDPRHARVRLRGMADLLAEQGLSAQRLAATAARMARARDALEPLTAQAMERCAVLHGAGFANVDLNALQDVSEEIALRLIARLVRCLGGETYPPRFERVERLLARMRAGQGGTLAGARVVVDQESAVFAREFGRAQGPQSLLPGCSARWDGRFRAQAEASAPNGLTLGGLGHFGLRRAAKILGARLTAAPVCARPGIPAIYGPDGLCAVPHLGYNLLGEALRIRADFTMSATANAHCLV